MKNFAIIEKTFSENAQNTGDSLLLYAGQFQPRAFRKSERLYIIEKKEISKYHPIISMKFMSPCNALVPCTGFYFLLEKIPKRCNPMKIEPSYRMIRIPQAVNF